jgi:hypothetical protein
MERKTAVILGITGLLVLFNASLALSEGEPVAAESALAAPQEKNEPETRWVWGEVTNVDAQNKTLSLKYLDYDTEEEKELTVTADDLTGYENVKSLEEIQVKASVSIDYLPGDGKNIARSISLEKSDAGEVTGPGSL